MNRTFFSLIVLFTFIACRNEDSVKTLIITGGHKFDREAFFEMFGSFESLDFEEAIQPSANQMIESGVADRFDLLIFYDMYDSITEGQKSAYIKMFAEGKPAIFLHHSLVSYQDWPEFQSIIGGKYNREDSLLGPSTYLHDTDIELQVMNPNHPITKGLSDFTFFDETYGNCPTLSTIEPLLATSHPNSMPYLAWVKEYGKSKIVYIQNGHGPQIFKDSNYRTLLQQAIDWTIQDN